MRRLRLVIYTLFLLTFVFAVRAQEQSNFSSTINWYYSACEDRMVVDLHGTLQAGYDVYYQAFDLFGGLGNPITALRRVSVNGDYSLTQVVNWLGGSTRALGTPISVVFRIGLENDPDVTIFQEASDDYLGECLEPGSTLEEVDILGTGDIIASSGVFTPDGGLLNPVFYEPPEALVQIGARPSDYEVVGRTANPGLIFAECADVEGADPGLIYDTDELLLFWSWFAKTPEQVQDHLNNALYKVELRGMPLPDWSVSEIKQVPGSLNWWVFYTADLGGKWEPGTYGVNFAVRWVNPISDGYESFGPGTENELLDSGCLFTVQRNPWDVPVIHENPTLPLTVYNDPESTE